MFYEKFVRRPGPEEGNKGKQNMIRDKSFYRQFFHLYIVLVLQNVVTLSVNLADNVMIGAYSEAALSGVTMVNHIQFIYQQIVNALGGGIVIFGSQYFGKNQITPVKKISAFAAQCALAVSVLLFCLVSVFPEAILRVFTDDKEILAEAVKYIRLIRFTYPFFAVSTLLLSMLRSVQLVNIAFYLSLAALGINCALNYALIYGRLGMPEMGVEGAAISTIAARVAELLILLYYVFRHQKKISVRPRDFLAFDKCLAADYLRIVTPSLIMASLWGVNTALQTVILGRLQSEAIAANSVASTIFMVVKSAAYGAGAATGTIIGSEIGKGDMKRVRQAANTLQKLFVLIGLAGGLVLFVIRTPLLKIYNLSPETMQMADAFLVVLSVVFVAMSYQMPAKDGIILGGGSASFTAKLDMISIWLIVLPVSFFMAFVVEASPVVVLCCLNADQVFKCIPVYWKINHGEWVKKVTRDENAPKPQ